MLLVGVIPAWGAHRLDVAAGLRASSPQAGRRGWRTQRTWVIAQVTLSVALVASGMSVFHSMQRILAIHPGYQPEKVLMATMDLSLPGYNEDRGTQVFRDLVSRVSSLPGVAAATLGKSSPAVDWSDRLAVFRPGETPPGGLIVDCNIIAPDYFRTLSIPLVAGRDFAATDRRGAPPVVIVSASLAAKLWPGESAVGRQMNVVREPMQVVGVAADSRYRSLIADSPALVYVPLTQHYDSIARLMVAVEGDARPFKQTLMRALQEAAPDLPIRSVNTMQEQIE